jgi:hypothetical protein
LSSALATGLKTFTTTGNIAGSLAAGVGAGALTAIAGTQELTLRESANAAGLLQQKIAVVQGISPAPIAALPSPGIEAAAAQTIETSLAALGKRVQETELAQRMTDIRDFKLRCDMLAADAASEFTVVEGLVTAMEESPLKTSLAAGLKALRTDLATATAKLEAFALKVPAEGTRVTPAELDALRAEVVGLRTPLAHIVTTLASGKQDATPRPPAPAPQGGARDDTPTAEPSAPVGELGEMDQFLLNSLLGDEDDIDVLIEVRRKLLAPPPAPTGARRRTYRKRKSRTSTRGH